MPPPAARLSTITTVIAVLQKNKKMIIQQRDIEQANRENFRVCLEVLSRPGTTGTITPVFKSHLATLAHCLLYADVSSFFKGDEDYQQIRAITGSPEATTTTADYIFCEQEDLEILAAAKIGTLVNPEHSATLLIQTDSAGNGGTDVVLSGPGIQGTTKKTLSVESTFIDTLRQKNGSFPLGVDCFFLDLDGTLTGITRTTRLETN